MLTSLARLKAQIFFLISGNEFLEFQENSENSRAVKNNTCCFTLAVVDHNDFNNNCCGSADAATNERKVVRP